MPSHTLFCPAAPPPQMPQQPRTQQSPSLQMTRTGRLWEGTSFRTAAANTAAWPKQRVTQRATYLFQVHPSLQKAWKVRAQTAPASLSCVLRAAFILRMSTSTLDSWFSIFFLIHQNRFMLNKDHSVPLSLLLIKCVIRADECCERNLSWTREKFDSLWLML